jgi:DNA-binding LacI/PurR family transcriptional regulator
MCGRIIIVKKKHRIATRHPTEVRGDVIIVIKKNLAKTMSSSFVRQLNDNANHNGYNVYIHNCHIAFYSM